MLERDGSWSTRLLCLGEVVEWDCSGLPGGVQRAANLEVVVVVVVVEEVAVWW